MNPFLNSDIYHSATVHPFDQEKILDKDDPGICFALLLAWQDDFLSAKNLGFRNFWKNMQSPDFIKQLVEKQKQLSLPVWTGMGFRTELDKMVKEYGLKRTPLSSAVVKPNDLSALQGLATGGKAQLIFLKKDQTESTGHIICIALRKKLGGGCEVGIFDANYGELVFDYDSFVDVTKKMAIEDNPWQDTRHPISIHTYEDAFKDLLTFYKQSPEQQIKGNEHKQYCSFKLHPFNYEQIKPTLTINTTGKENLKTKMFSDGDFNMFDDWRRRRDRSESPKKLKLTIEPILTTQLETTTTADEEEFKSVINSLKKMR